jgi:hypothetical protein
MFFSVPEPNWPAVFWIPSFMFMSDYPDWGFSVLFPQL